MHVDEMAMDGDEKERQAKLMEIKDLKHRIMELHAELGDAAPEAAMAEASEGEGSEMAEGSPEEEDVEAPAEEMGEMAEGEGEGDAEDDPHGFKSYLRGKKPERRPGTAIMIAMGKPKGAEPAPMMGKSKGKKF